jgi:hypothetical protein
VGVSVPITKEAFADQTAPARSRQLNPNRLTLIETCAVLPNVRQSEEEDGKEKQDGGSGIFGH